jgi:nicotinamidase-related amidase
MSSLANRPETALLVIDVQNDVMAGAHNRDGVIANIALLVDKARAANVRLTQQRSEPVVHKRYGDSFDDTDLEAILAERRVGHVIVSGAQTDECIRSTLHGAIVRGYDTTLVADAHTTEDHSEWGAPTPDLVIAHTNLYWQYHTAPGRSAATVSTDSVQFN